MRSKRAESGVAQSAATKRARAADPVPAGVPARRGERVEGAVDADARRPAAARREARRGGSRCRCRDRAGGARRCRSGRRASAISTRVSVSGRGSSVPGESAKGRPQNSRQPEDAGDRLAGEPAATPSASRRSASSAVSRSPGRVQRARRRRSRAPRRGAGGRRGPGVSIAGLREGAPQAASAPARVDSGAERERRSAAMQHRPPDVASLSPPRRELRRLVLRDERVDQLVERRPRQHLRRGGRGSG